MFSWLENCCLLYQLVHAFSYCPHTPKNRLMRMSHLPHLFSGDSGAAVAGFWFLRSASGAAPLPGAQMFNVTKENYAQEVTQSEKPVVLQFTAR